MIVVAEVQQLNRVAKGQELGVGGMSWRFAVDRAAFDCENLWER